MEEEEEESMRGGWLLSNECVVGVFLRSESLEVVTKPGL